MGSLVAALGSYLNIRSQDGEWLVRMEDIDPPREEPGAADSILKSLETHGLHWHGDIIYQSQRSDAYEAMLEQLHQQGLTYRCSCSRKQIEMTGHSGEFGPVYPGSCRDKSVDTYNSATRIRVNDNPVITHDRIQGDYQQSLHEDIGDFVVKRRDNLYAYHLAVVVDDAEQGITEIVRGVDLLDSTPRQQYLQHCLGLTTPVYAHLPVVLNQYGQKLSKQNQAPALDDRQASANIYNALLFLQQAPPAELEKETVETQLRWALTHWQLNKISQYQKKSGSNQYSSI
jgi:glutamyl-Q tRNA(Asp) synthetase